MFRFLSLHTIFLFLFIAPVGVASDEPQVQEPQPWQWMLGTHTNYQHTLRKPEAASTPVLYSVRRVQSADTEGVVLLSEQAYLFTPDEPIRRRIYQFIPRRQGWIQHIFEVAPELSVDQLARAEHWQPLQGCSLRWEKQDGYFSAGNDPEDCYFFVEESGERVAVSSSIKLYPDYFVITDDLAFTDELTSEYREQNTLTEYQRTTFYDPKVRYSSLANDQWQPVSTTGPLHDQGARVGLVLDQSELELRYQIELQRSLTKLTFKLYDISSGDVIHEETFEDDVAAIEYHSARLHIRLKPRP